MTAAFGHKWTSVHGDDFAHTSGCVWAEDLAGITPEQLQRGLRLARRESWPPGAGDFRALCLGCLSPTQVEVEMAGDLAAQSPFTTLVRRNLDDHQYRIASSREARAMLEAATERARAHVLAGGRLPEYTPADRQLVDEDRRPPPPPLMVTASEAMAEIQRSLGIRKRAPEEGEPEPEAKPLPPACTRCRGLRVDPDKTSRIGEPIECLACFGSGVESPCNRIVHPDGTLEERIP